MPIPNWIYRERLRVGARIRTIREERKLSQEALAHTVDLDRKTINRIETGTRAITVDQAAMLARALHVPIWRIFADQYDIEANVSEPDTPEAG